MLRAKRQAKGEGKGSVSLTAKAMRPLREADRPPCVVQESQRRKCIPSRELAELKGAHPSHQNRWPSRLWNEVVIPRDPASDKAEMALPVIRFGQVYPKPCPPRQELG